MKIIENSGEKILIDTKTIADAAQKPCFTLTLHA